MPLKVVLMSLWIWIGIAAFATIALGLLVALMIGRILGTIGREISEVLDAGAQAWVALPPARARRDQTALESDEFGSQAETVRSREEQLVPS